jgi:hypothetical protein
MIETEAIAQLVREALERGASVEIDGLGIFRSSARNGLTFESKALPKVFIAYVEEDAALSDRLYDAFAANGLNPWMDRRKLMPGQNWPRAIQEALETSDFVVACFSSHSVRKKGGFQAEIRYALDCAALVPLDEIFLVPVRLNDCQVPAQIRRLTQYVDLFPDWNHGFERILGILQAQIAAKRFTS